MTRTEWMQRRQELDAQRPEPWCLNLDGGTWKATTHANGVTITYQSDPISGMTMPVSHFTLPEEVIGPLVEWLQR